MATSHEMSTKKAQKKKKIKSTAVLETSQ